MCNPHIRNGELWATFLRVEHVHKFLGILLHGGFVYYLSFIYLFIQSFLYMSRYSWYSFHTLNSNLIVLCILLLQFFQFWPLRAFPLTPVSLWCNPMVLCALFLFVFLALSYFVVLQDASDSSFIFPALESVISPMSPCSFIGEQY